MVDNMQKKAVTIIGAGLAGCEAALQLESKGYPVKIYDSKPNTLLPVYSMKSFGELVCNSSLGKNSISTALGALIEELRMMGSKLISIADECKVKDDEFLAVDKSAFSNKVTEAIYSSNIKVFSSSICDIPDDDIVIIATGPLTGESLAHRISCRYNIAQYHFSDASSPVVDLNSIDINNSAIKQVSEDLYYVIIDDYSLVAFYNALLEDFHSYHRPKVDNDIAYEKCQSIELIAKKGLDYLIEKKLQSSYSSRPSILLRRENGLENGFILVGCMTTLPHAYQRLAFSKLPGFKDIRFVKYGRMHRNTFFKCNNNLNGFYRIIDTNAYLIGQLSGIDGYAPAISSGLVAAIDIVSESKCPPLPISSVIGGLAHYVSNPDITDFEPMCASFSLIPSGIYEPQIAKRGLYDIKKQLEALELQVGVKT